MVGIIEWVLANKTALIEGYLALIGLASIVIRLTPNVRDDAWLKKYLRFVGKYISLNRK